MKVSKFLSVALASAITFSAAVPAFASVSDVAENNWAKPIVEYVVDKGIMNLYEGDRFIPSAEATQVEAVIALYRTAKQLGLINQDEIDKWVTFHEKEFVTYGIPKTLATYGNDVYPAVAYAIENNIITPTEAKAFVSGGKLTQINKVTMSVFVGRALNVYKKETLNPMATVSYKDATSIPLSALRYIDFIVKNNIITSTGDSNGNFAPQTPLTRTLLATFIKGYHVALEKIADDVKPEPTTPETTEPEETKPEETKPEEKPTETTQEVKQIQGEVMNYKGGTDVTLKTTSGNMVLSLANTPILYNGLEVGLNEIANGTVLTAKVQSGITLEVSVAKTFDKIEGTLSLLGSTVASTPAFKPLRIELANKTFDNKRLYDDAVIVVDEKISTIDKIAKGDKITVYSDGYKVKRIVAYTGEYDMSATLLSEYDTVKKGTVTLLSGEGLVHKLVVKDTAALIATDKLLMKDTIVKARVQDGVVVRLEVIGKKEVISGMVSGIHIKQKPEITLKISGKDTTFTTSDNILYLDEQGTRILSVYDLRLNQSATVYKGIGGVYKLQLGQVKTTAEDKAIYTVIQVFESANLVTVFDKDGAVKTVAVKVADDFKLSDLKPSMKISLEGSFLTNDLIEATKIIIQK